MCCQTHFLGYPGPAAVAEAEDFRCRCGYGGGRCPRRSTGEDMRCDTCRECPAPEGGALTSRGLLSGSLDEAVQAGLGDMRLGEWRRLWREVAGGMSAGEFRGLLQERGWGTGSSGNVCLDAVPPSAAWQEAARAAVAAVRRQAQPG